jgi:pyridoxal phosphate enzyme (YggS family)
MVTAIANNLTAIKNQISAYEKKYDRKQGEVKLLAVSKNQPVEKIKAAIEAGQFAFGENYLQEALAKMMVLADKRIEWHFIGPIQSNKTRKIAEHFAWVHSIDSLKIAKRLNDQRPPHLTPLNVCIEVNVSAEATKSGVKLDDAASLISDCLSLPRLKLRGLMTIPASYDNFSDQRHAFHKLYSLWQTLHQQNSSFDTLSMGMSNDFEAAIAEGSTLVRIGTAIFGERKYSG